MKLTNALAVDYSSSGFADAKTFGFEMNAFAFDTVINRIYSDKIESPVREYCTNAYDAHLMVGKGDIPFEIAAPSDLNPHFRVRDYGPGMSHDEIMERATTMFASSKRDTNDQVGMIGLGMKSAFAYTDAFTITAFRGKTKQVYTCFRDAAGLPTVATLPEEDCISPKGIEISFPVKQHQLRQFRSAIAKVMLGFEPRPHVINETWQPPQAPKLLEGKGWHVLGTDLFKRIHVRQGCVLYPVDFDKLPDSDGVSYEQKWMPLIIDVPIGSVSVVTSREGLEYDDETVTYLTARIKEVFADARAETVAGFDKHDDFHDACQAFLRAGELALKMAGKDLMWRRTRHLQRQFILSGRMRSKLRANLVDTNAYFIKWVNVEETCEPHELRGATILYEDEGSVNAAARVKSYRLANPDDVLIWVKELQPHAAMREFGLTKSVGLSTIEPLKVQRFSTAHKTVRSDLRAFNEDRTLHSGCDLDKGGYYVLTDGAHYQWRGVGGTKFAAIDKRFLYLARKLGLLDKPVYALVANQRTIPQQHEGWMSLEARLEQAAATFDPKNWAIEAGYHSFTSSYDWGLLLSVDGRAPKRLQRFIDKVKAVRAPEQSYDLLQLWERMGNDLPPRDRSLETEAAKLFELYPLLKVIGTDDKNTELMTHYLNLLKR